MDKYWLCPLQTWTFELFQTFSRCFSNRYVQLSSQKGVHQCCQPIFGFSWVIFMCPQREEEVGVEMFERRDDMHILPVFWFQTVRESKEADEVC